MEITKTVHAPDRATWRDWLERNHATAREIWLLKDKTTSNVSYLENVRKNPTEFAARLERLLDMTAQNKQFGGIEAKGML